MVDFGYSQTLDKDGKAQLAGSDGARAADEAEARESRLKYIQEQSQFWSDPKLSGLGYNLDIWQNAAAKGGIYTLDDFKNDPRNVAPARDMYTLFEGHPPEGMSDKEIMEWACTKTIWNANNPVSMVDSLHKELKDYPPGSDEEMTQLRGLAGMQFMRKMYGGTFGLDSQVAAAMATDPLNLLLLIPVVGWAGRAGIAAGTRVGLEKLLETAAVQFGERLAQRKLGQLALEKAATVGFENTGLRVTLQTAHKIAQKPITAAGYNGLVSGLRSFEGQVLDNSNLNVTPGGQRVALRDGYSIGEGLGHGLLGFGTAYGLSYGANKLFSSAAAGDAHLPPGTGAPEIQAPAAGISGPKPSEVGFLGTGRRTSTAAPVTSSEAPTRPMGFAPWTDPPPLSAPTASSRTTGPQMMSGQSSPLMGGGSQPSLIPGVADVSGVTPLSSPKPSRRIGFRADHNSPPTTGSPPQAPPPTAPAPAAPTSHLGRMWNWFTERKIPQAGFRGVSEDGKTPYLYREPGASPRWSVREAAEAYQGLKSTVADPFFPALPEALANRYAKVNQKIAEIFGRAYGKGGLTGVRSIVREAHFLDTLGKASTPKEILSVTEGELLEKTTAFREFLDEAKKKTFSETETYQINRFNLGGNRIGTYNTYIQKIEERLARIETLRQELQQMAKEAQRTGRAIDKTALENTTRELSDNVNGLVKNRYDGVIDNSNFALRNPMSLAKAPFKAAGYPTVLERGPPGSMLLIGERTGARSIQFRKTLWSNLGLGRFFSYGALAVGIGAGLENTVEWGTGTELPFDIGTTGINFMASPVKTGAGVFEGGIKGFFNMQGYEGGAVNNAFYYGFERGPGEIGNGYIFGTRIPGIGLGGGRNLTIFNSSAGSGTPTAQPASPLADPCTLDKDLCPPQQNTAPPPTPEPAATPLPNKAKVSDSDAKIISPPQTQGQALPELCRNTWGIPGIG